MDNKEFGKLSGTFPTFKKNPTKILKLKAIKKMNTISEETENNLLNYKSSKKSKTNFEKLPLLNNNDHKISNFNFDIKNSELLRKKLKNVFPKEKKMNYFTPGNNKNNAQIQDTFYKRLLNVNSSDTKNKLFGMEYDFKSFDNFDEDNSNSHNDTSNPTNGTILNKKSNNIFNKKKTSPNLKQKNQIQNIKIKNEQEKKIQSYCSQKKVLKFGASRIEEPIIIQEKEKEIYNNKNLNLSNNKNVGILMKKSKDNITIKNFSREKILKDSIEIKTNSSTDKNKSQKSVYNSTFIFRIKNDEQYIYYYQVTPGNNARLIEDCILTRKNWEKLPEDLKDGRCNLLFTPLSNEIDFLLHKNIYITHVVNHFESHCELSNKKNLFINLLRYCEFHNINLFEFFPLTVIVSLTQKNFESQLEGFRKCYTDLPNLIENSENKLDKTYSQYFTVNLSKKVGSKQKIIIPKTHYIGYNIWLIKRSNLNRGRQIYVMSNVDKLINEIKETKQEIKLRYLILQKYIEDPLLYNCKKFDIRIWVLLTYMLSEEKYELYVFKEGHLKSCSENYNISSNNLYVHLTNYSVQKYSKNFSKDDIGNEISYEKFQNFLNKKTKKINFKEDILTKIYNIIKITFNAVKNKINIMDRKNCFEIFGYDFILDKNYNPFLLEINTNPGYEESSPLIKMLVPRMIDDALRLTVDKIFERKENDQYKNKSKFHVDGYEDSEIMWQKIKLK